MMRCYKYLAVAFVLMAGCMDPPDSSDANTGNSGAIVLKKESPSQTTSPSPDGSPAAPSATAAPPSPVPTPSPSGRGSTNPQSPVLTGVGGLSEDQILSNLAQSHSRIMELLNKISDEDTARQYKEPLQKAITQSEQSWRRFWAYLLVKKTSGGTVNDEAVKRATNVLRNGHREMIRISKTSALPVIKQDLVRIVRMGLDAKPKGSWSERDEKLIQGNLKAAGLAD